VELGMILLTGEREKIQLFSPELILNITITKKKDIILSQITRKAGMGLMF